MKNNSVFYISEGVVKFLQVSGKIVTGVDVINISQQDDAQIVKTLNGFLRLRNLNFEESRVTIVLPRSRAILRFMSFPSHKDEEIRSMIDLQVGSNIPYVREEVEIDFQVLSKTEDGYTKVAVVIIPQEISMRFWRIFSEAKIPVHQITISSVGLWLLYQQQSGMINQLGAIFDLDVNHCEICLCYKDRWVTSREIPIGFTQMQQNGYTEILNQWDLTQGNSSHGKAIDPVQSVYLVSSANRAYALAVEMAKVKSELTIKEIFLTQTLSLAKSVQWPKLITDDGLSLAPLVGIALSADKPPIDLIPNSVKTAQQQSVYQRQLIFLGVWLVLGLISLGAALGMGFFNKNLQLANMTTQLHEAKYEAQKVTEQLKKISDIEGVMKGRLIFADVAREINRILPAQIYLVNIVINNGNTLSFQGVSSSEVAINKFQTDLISSQSFSNVVLNYENKRITQQGEEDYFKITCALKTVKGQK